MPRLGTRGGARDPNHMSCSLNSIKGGSVGGYIGEYCKDHQGKYKDFRLELIYQMCQFPAAAI